MPSEINRRQAVAAIALATAGAQSFVRAGTAPRFESATALEGELKLPDLPFAFDALEPVIDAETMKIHHGKHHKAYVDNANAALKGTPLEGMAPDKIIVSLASAPDAKRNAIRNNVGGHVNHTLFWESMSPPTPGRARQPGGILGDAITAAFGSFDAKGGFKEQFIAAATGRFGSGWAWLVVRDGKLAICSTANQDNPVMGEAIAGASGTPILGLDVWEHAYYLKYRNLRKDYAEAWWEVVNWARVTDRFAMVAPR